MPMKLVLYSPMSSVQGEDIRGGVVEAGNEMNGVDGCVAGFAVLSGALHGADGL